MIKALKFLFGFIALVAYELFLAARSFPIAEDKKEVKKHEAETKYEKES